MCKSLRHLANHMQSLRPLGVGTMCSTTDGCLGIQCSTERSLAYVQSLEILLHPCRRPRALKTKFVFGGALSWNEVVNHSAVFSLTSGLFPVRQLNVTFEDRIDSVLVGVSDWVLCSVARYYVTLVSQWTTFLEEQTA